MKEKTGINDSGKVVTDLDRQHEYVEELKKKGSSSYALVAAEAFVRGMRDSGYKSTATAIDEFVDNSIQADARRVDIVCEIVNPSMKVNDIGSIAIVDDGHGMEPEMIRAAVMWGGTHRENDRRGMGRYGFGLPSAAVGITKRYEVYSLTEGGAWHRVCIDLDEIAAGKHTDGNGLVVAPMPEQSGLPKFVVDYLGERELQHGTVILLAEPDRLTGFKKPGTFEKKMLEHLGLIYRGLLRNCQLFVNGKRVDPIDPLFLNPAARFYDVKNGVFAEALEGKTFSVKTQNGKVEGAIRMRISSMPNGFQEGPDEAKKGRLNVIKENQAYFIVTRAGRQIDLVTRPSYSKESNNTTLTIYDRNWAIEIDFDPILDEEFGITVNKQQVKLSDRLWDIFENEGVPAIVKELKRRFKESKNDEGTRDEEEKEKTRDSEKVMSEIEKFMPPTETPVEKEKESIEKVERVAEEKAKREKKSKEVVIREIIAETKGAPYKVGFEPLPGAPFYSLELFGDQKQLKINTRHRFYTDLYNGPDSTQRLRTSLELLLFVLGVCEVEAVGEREDFYRCERQQWSIRLENALSALDKAEPIEDELAAKQDEEETAEVEENPDSE